MPGFFEKVGKLFETKRTTIWEAPLSWRLGAVAFRVFTHGAITPADVRKTGYDMSPEKIREAFDKMRAENEARAYGMSDKDLILALEESAREAALMKTWDRLEGGREVVLGDMTDAAPVQGIVQGRELQKKWLRDLHSNGGPEYREAVASVEESVFALASERGIRLEK